MTIKTIDEHAYEIVTEEGTFAVCKDTLAKFDATKHEHGVAACGEISFVRPGAGPPVAAAAAASPATAATTPAASTTTPKSTGARLACTLATRTAKATSAPSATLPSTPTRSATMRYWPTSRNSRPSWLSEF